MAELPRHHVTGHWEQTGEIGDYLTSVGGLIVGGVPAAPAGWVIKTLQEKTLLRLVGSLITLLAGYQTLELTDVL
ncbi:putative membrane protein YfcA [Sinorhizobium terangae]|nr:putative membrane protein YfcA [Sinorhizobium terangae]